MCAVSLCRRRSKLVIFSLVWTKLYVAFHFLSFFGGLAGYQNQELAKTRESLVGAETSKKHLEQRVEDLTKYFESNKEKLAVYERRGTTSVSNDAQSELTKEQQLETEVAELRYVSLRACWIRTKGIFSASLKVAERDLERAKERVAQFESIAKAAEEALGQLHSTHDQYKLSTDETISRHEVS